MEPSLGPGIDLMAEMFDDQLTPEFEDATTYFDEEIGERVSRAWQAPRTMEELLGPAQDDRVHLDQDRRHVRPPAGPRRHDRHGPARPQAAVRRTRTSELSGDTNFADNIDSYIEHAAATT